MFGRFFNLLELFNSLKYLVFGVIMISTSINFWHIFEFFPTQILTQKAFQTEMIRRYAFFIKTSLVSIFDTPSYGPFSSSPSIYG